MQGIARWVAVGVLALGLALPATALAADTYVDADTGSDANPCTLALPCMRITEGIGNATPGATVHVDPDTYAEAVGISDGKSLVAEEFVGGAEGPAVINGGSSSALTVGSGGAGQVSGFTFDSTADPVIDVGGGLQNFIGNTVDVAGAGAVGVYVNAPGADVAILQSRFLGDDTSAQVAVRIENATSPNVSENLIGAPGAGFNGGIWLIATPGSPLIMENEFVAMLQSASTVGQPILAEDAAVTIAENVVRASAPGDAVQAVGLFETSSAPATAAELHRNQFYGNGFFAGIGMSLGSGAFGPITLDSDVIAGFSPGIRAEADLSVTNATIASAGFDDIALASNSLALDSSILTKGISSAIGASCTITFSRGPTTAPGGDGCSAFQTSAPPGFVDADPVTGEPDLHLLQGSAMIDAGNPASPPAPSGTDIDGDPRALEGDCSGGPARRDIGADEFAELDCDPPQTRIKGPRRTTRERVRFRLFSDETGSSFRCKLDRGRYRRCRARYRTPRLEPGRHTLRAKAIDPAGNQDPTPAVKRFRVIGD